MVVGVPVWMDGPTPAAVGADVSRSFIPPFRAPPVPHPVHLDAVHRVWYVWTGRRCCPPVPASLTSLATVLLGVRHLITQYRGGGAHDALTAKPVSSYQMALVHHPGYVQHGIARAELEGKQGNHRYLHEGDRA